MAPKTQDQGSLRLLIVDDDVSQLRTISDIMRAEGFEIIACTTASEALQHLEGGKVDVAVVDLRLPDLGEEQLLQRLSAVSEEVPIVINTGYASLRSAKDALNSGVFAYVEKAGDPAQLVHHVHRAVETRLQRYASALEKAVSERTRELQQANEILKQAQRQAADLARFPSEDPDPVLRVAPGGHVLYANAATREILLGDEATDLVRAFPKWGAIIKRALGSAAQEELEEQLGGRVFSFVFAPVVDRGYVNVYGHDITKCKMVEQRLTESREALRSLAARLQVVREEERTQLARRIHDDVGQALIGLKMDLAWLGRNISKAPDRPQAAKLSERLDSMAEALRETIQTVRDTASDLRPGLLDDVGLAATIAWQASQFETRTGVKCIFVGPDSDLGLARDQTTAMFRICQELLTNTAQHAGATTVRIVLTKSEDNMTLEVSDDGKGIEDEQVASSGSLGILGMRERAQILGGELSITGRPGKGTTATVRIPLLDAARAQQQQRDATRRP